jgi:hypothetical protein
MEVLKKNLSVELQKQDIYHHANNLADLNSKAICIHNTLQQCINSATTIKYFKTKRSNPDWWDAELETLKQQLKEDKAKHNLEDSRESFLIQRNTKRMYFQLIKKKKSHSFKDFCSTRNLSQSTKLLRNLQKPHHVNHLSIPSILDSNDQPFADNSSALNFLLDTLAPGHSFYSPEEIPFSTNIGLPTDPGEYISLTRAAELICSSSRLSDLLREINFNTAPGPNNLTYNILNNCWETLLEPLKLLFMDCFLLGAIPNCWLFSSGIFLPKPDLPAHFPLNIFVP